MGEEFVKRWKTDKDINNSGQGHAEIHNNIEVEQTNKQPVKAANDYQYPSYHMQSFHFVHPLSKGFWSL